MTRAEVAAWFGERYGAYLEAANRPAEDSPEGIGAAIDDAFRALGVDDADLAGAVTADTATARHELRLQVAYRAMDQVVRDLAGSFDLSDGGSSLKLSQLRGNAEKDRDQAASAVLARFGTLDLVADVAATDDPVIEGNFLITGPRAWL